MSSNDDDIAQRTLAAKREAEKLKEKIKRKKESLADTTCKRELSLSLLYKKEKADDDEPAL